MNDWQLYELYTSIQLKPHLHRHYTFEEFVDKLNEDPNFRNVILNK